jgi:hypothetical protein
MMKNPLIWVFIGTALVSDLVSSFLTVCFRQSDNCAGKLLRDTLSYRVFELIAHHYNFVLAAGAIAIAAYAFTLWLSTDKIAGAAMNARVSSRLEHTDKPTDTA